MASISQNLNPMLQRMRSSGVFGAGVNEDMQRSVAGTQNNLRFGTPSATPAVTMPDMGVSVPAMAPNPLSVATGSLFGKPTQQENAAVQSLPPAVQTAGFLSGLPAQGKVFDFQRRLMDAGINLNPDGQAPGDFQRNVAAAQGLYNSVFGAGLPPAQQIEAFSPTGLRQEAINARGAPVEGFGGVRVSANPNVGGGTSFYLTSNPNRAASLSAPIPPTPQGVSNAAMDFLRTGIAPDVPEPQSTPQAASAPIAAPRPPTPFEQAAGQFQRAMTMPKQALEPGYEMDPMNPGAVRPIAGSKAATEAQKAQMEIQANQKAVQEKTRQTIANTQNVISVLDRVFPRINQKTAGWGSLLKSVPESDAKAVAADLETINANLGLDRLLELRAAATSGSSGLGQLTEKEFERLVAAKRNLDQAQSPDQIKSNLTEIRDSYRNLNMMARGINPETNKKADATQTVGKYKVRIKPAQ